jgi:hypothetical protein
VASIDDKEHLLFSCNSTKDIRLHFAGLPMPSLRDLLQYEDAGRERALVASSVAWFAHDCMERVDNNQTG